jgi:hypothetical protein
MSFQYNGSTGATRVICPGELRPSTLGALLNLDVLDTLTAGQVQAQNLYTRTQVDELFGTWSYRLSDGSLAPEKIQGLSDALGRLVSVIEHSNYVQSLVSSLTTVVATKVSTAELQNGSLGLNLASVTASGELRAATLDISGTTLANMIVASNVDAISVTAKIGAFGHFSSDLIFDNDSTLHLAYRDDPFAVRIGNTSARVGINCEVTASSGLSLDCVGGARFSGNLTAGAMVINSQSSDISAIIGNDDSFLRIKHGRHLDAYDRNGGGVDINLCNHTQSAVRIAAKLSIGMTPNAYQLAVSGAANVTDFCMCPAYRIGSDKRLKADVEDASWAECTRLVLAVRPKTYVLKSTGLSQCGYIAQDWRQETQDAYRNSIVGEALGDEKFLCLDYSRIVPILHAALLSALARIDALESRT